MSDDLTTRLLAAIEEVEHAARAAGGYYDDHVDEACDACAGHMVRHEPAAVMRRCQADRKIVALHCVSSDSLSRPECRTCVGNWTTETGEDYPCETLRALAEGYGLEVDK